MRQALMEGMSKFEHMWLPSEWKTVFFLRVSAVDDSEKESRFHLDHIRVSYVSDDFRYHELPSQLVSTPLAAAGQSSEELMFRLLIAGSTGHG